MDASGQPLTTDQQASRGCSTRPSTCGEYKAQVASPLPPHDVVAVSDTAGVHLDWTWLAKPDFAYFRVYRSPAPGGPYTRIANRSP